MNKPGKNMRRLLLERLTERLNFSNTYFIDPVHGDDSHTGLSPDQAWHTPARIVSQYYNLQPTGHVDLEAGDTVVLMPGEHQFAYRYGDVQWQGLFFRNVHGTADKPITVRALPGATVANMAPDGTEMPSLYVLQSSHFRIEGLDITAHGSAITVAASEHVSLRNNYIHDADGSAHDNLSGLYLSGNSDVWVEDNFFVDNYDRSRPGNQNNRHIVVFGSLDTHILRNTLFNHQSDVGSGVTFKHLGGLPANGSSVFEVAHNTIVNANGVGIGSSAPNSMIHHNLLIDSGVIRIADFGGTDQLSNEHVEFNTVVNSKMVGGPGAFEFIPNEYPGHPLGSVYWNNNLVSDTRGVTGAEDSTIIVDRYGSDDFYTRVIKDNLLRADQNFYQSSTPSRFDLYGAAGRYGSLGSELDFEKWQAAGFDRSGAAIDLALDTLYQSSAAEAAGAGIYASGTPRIKALVDTMDIDESGARSTARVHFVRTGPLDEALSVAVTVSDGQQLQAPSSVHFAAGSATAEMTFRGTADQAEEPTQAIQLRFQAQGWAINSAWVFVHDVQPSFDTPVEGIFQVPGEAGTMAQLDATVLTRWAEYNNEMGLAYVDDAQGRVGQLLPGDEDWARALVSRGQHQVLLASGVGEGAHSQAELVAGRYYVLFLVQNASLSHWLEANQSDTPAAQVWLFTSIPGSNRDNFDHLHENVLTNGLQVAWEDLEYGGDQSFRDLIVDIKFSEGEPNYCRPVNHLLTESLHKVSELLPQQAPATWSIEDPNREKYLRLLDTLLEIIDLWR